MKAILLAIAVISTNAQSSELCELMGEYAKKVMEYRIDGVEAKKLYSMTKKLDEQMKTFSVFQDMVNRAYGQDLNKLKKGIDDVEFGNKYYVACMIAKKSTGQSSK